jgi:hypothetical protein
LTGFGLGEVLKRHAHAIAKELLRIAADYQLNEGDPELLSEAAALSLALPGPQRGRPPKASTLELQQLLAEVGTKLGAAKAVSAKTGEPVHNLRRRLRPKKPSKPKRRRT